jgi:biotin transport system substrate-specific component
MNTPNLTLAGFLMPSDRVTKLAISVLLAIIGSLLLWASAKVKIDLPLVPITLQSLIVLALGAAYGWRLGAATVLLYLAEGAFGLPVFAGTPEKGIGLAYMLGPTGGYLLGFLAAAALVGWLAQKGADRNAFTMFGTMLLGAAVIYVPGIVWLAGWMMQVKAMDVQPAVAAALTGGFLPFIWGDVIKAALAAMAFPAAWLMLDRR